MESREIWERLEKQLKIHAPQLLASFRPAVEHSLLDEFEAETGLRLPDDIRFAYMRYNGTVFTNWDQINLFGGIRWWPLAEVIEQWRNTGESIEQLEMSEVYDFDESDPNWHVVPIRPFSFITPNKWIPIGDAYGTILYIDFLPGPTGLQGQLIKHYSHGASDFSVMAPSFQAYLSDLVRNLENGKIAVLTRPGTQMQYWGHKGSNVEFTALGHANVYPLV